MGTQAPRIGAVTIVLVLALAGCLGGGDDPADPTEPANTTEAPGDASERLGPSVAADDDELEPDPRQVHGPPAPPERPPRPAPPPTPPGGDGTSPGVSSPAPGDATESAASEENESTNETQDERVAPADPIEPVDGPVDADETIALLGEDHGETLDEVAGKVDALGEADAPSTDGQTGTEPIEAGLP